MALVISGSLSISGSVSAETIIISSSAVLSATSSYALTASYVEGGASPVLAVTGSTIYSVNPSTSNVDPDNSIFIGANAGLNTIGGASPYESVFLGVSAGQSAAGAANSVFLGAYAGQSSANAAASVFVGRYAGWSAPNAANSTFLGSGAGYNADNASEATFVGAGTGDGATNAKESVFLGLNAGNSATNASSSVFIGLNAGFQAMKADYSTIIGYGAGYNNVTPNGGPYRNNIIIGTNVTLEQGRKDSINIGGLIFGTGSYWSTDTVSSNSANGRIGINQPLPVYSLDVSGSGNYSNGLTATGSLKITGSITVNDKVSNVLSVTGSSLYSAPSTRQVGTDNGIFIGFGAGQETNNISPFGNKGNECVFVGNYAGYQAQITRYSTFLGYYSGFQAYQVDYGTFLGHYAGNLADAADYSTMIGASAGDSAIQASNSVIIGSNAGVSATNAEKSVFVGNGAGNIASTSSYSTFLGYQAGKTTVGNGPGRNNIIIGSNVSLEAQRQDSINIGGLIFGTGSYYNASDIISSGSANGKVGVNQPLPQYSLDVSGSIGLTDLFVLASKDTLPVSNVPSGSIMASGSGADFKPYFWNGATWTSLI